ncbi:MAG: chemotaxis protein CheW [Burkholderiaceae bacterium]|nr:chemotaxis protein CheW [Burkholderiaceae bacterium]
MTFTPSDDSSATQPEISSQRIERRKRLRQFQTDLAERMQQVREQADALENRLGVVAGQTNWLLDLMEVGEIVPATAITEVPMTKDWFLGLLNIRGNLVGVIDFARFLGMAPTPIENVSRIVTLAPTLGVNCGLLVTRITGFRDTAHMESMSDGTEITGDWAGQRYRDNDAQEWISLRLSSLVQDPRFLHIGL